MFNFYWKNNNLKKDDKSGIGTIVFSGAGYEFDFKSLEDWNTLCNIIREIAKESEIRGVESVISLTRALLLKKETK